MRPVVKTDRFKEDGSPLTFRHWGDAKIDLQTELGSYCSFCEREGYRSSLDVEHILAKGLPKYNDLIYRWDNFLLGCRNCNSIKGNSDFDISETYLPHLNNLLLTIEILEGGGIRVREDLPEEMYSRTKNFIELVGIDRDPAHPQYSNKDDRWESRMQAWEWANCFLADYQKREIRLQRIIDMAQSTGYWSVWISVFRDHTDVKRALVHQFAGTSITCFDHNFNPCPRNGDNP